MNRRLALRFVVPLAFVFLGLAAVADAADWKMAWHDEFDKDGPPDPANWGYERGFVRNNELQYYQPENATCRGGFLVIEARREHKANPDYRPGGRGWKNRQWIEYTSACPISRRKREFTYGKFEMRARIDTRLGSWPAFWTLGISRGWPVGGEVDIMEYYTGTVLANVCYGGAPASGSSASRIGRPHGSRWRNWAATPGRSSSTSGRWSGTSSRSICSWTASR